MKTLLKVILWTAYHTVSFVWLGLFFVIVSFWVRSYWIEDGVQIKSQVAMDEETSPDGYVWRQMWMVSSVDGCVNYHVLRSRYAPQVEQEPLFGDGTFVWSNTQEQVLLHLLGSTPIDKANADWRWLGLAGYHNAEPPPVVDTSLIQLPPGSTYFAVWVPYWMITLTVSVWPAIWLWLHARRVRNLKRMARGHCGKCNYDLRGNVNVEKCPECGAVPLFVSAKS